MIDASLGRASCCGFPSCMPPFPPPFPPPCPPPFPPQPDPPQPATTIPTAPSEPGGIQLRIAAAQTTLANGAVIPFTSAVRQLGSGLRFDQGTGAVSVMESGVYAFNWQMLVQIPTDDTAAPVIALQSLDGQTVLGYSGIPAAAAVNGALLSGTAVAFLPAGTMWVLVNASGAPMDILTAGSAPAVFAGSMSVTEISGR